jgi:ceramide synthetase
MCESTAKSTFHSTALIWGLVVLKQANWLPWCLGGEGSLEVVLRNNILTEVPFGVPPRAVITYGLFTSGYHLSELFRYTFIGERKSDFEEMVVHHIVTVMLYFGYIIANMHCVGAFIAVLHDVSDVFSNFGRIAQGSVYEKVSYFFFAIVLVTWAWTRLYILPYSIWFLESEMVPEFF